MAVAMPRPTLWRLPFQQKSPNMTESAIRSVAGLEAPAGRPRRFFFFGAAVFLLLIMLAGFSPTFYLQSFFPQAQRHPPAYVYFHGAVMTAWYLLAVTQMYLVPAGRRSLHRRLGIAGAVLASIVVATGFYVNRNLLPRVAALVAEPTPELQRLLVLATVAGLLILSAFALFVTAAILLRRNREAHGRLMFMALLATLGPALGPGRWLGQAVAPLLPWWLGLTTPVTAAFVIALGLHDWFARRRIHPVTLWGGLLLIALGPIAALVADSETGRAIVSGSAWAR